MAEVFGTLSVRVGASRTCLERQAERGRGDLEHLGVQALAHLGAAVVDQHRAVLVDVHERAGLVERREVERDAELHRRDREAALAVRVGLVERRDLRRTTGEVAGVEHLLPGPVEALGVPHRLAVRRGLAVGVEVAAAQLVGRDAEQRRAPAEDVLDHQHPLRAAEAAERGLRRLVGLRDPAVGAHVGDPVRVVDVAQRPGEHRLGQVEAPAAVRGQRRVEREQPAVGVEADPPGGVEAVPLAGHRDVLRAGQPEPDRATGQGRAERGDRGEAVRLHLLAAEAAAHPQALHGDVVAAPAEDVRHDLLGLGRVLGAALHEHLAGLVDVRQRGMRLQVEVLLAGHLDLALEDVRGLEDRRRRRRRARGAAACPGTSRRRSRRGARRSRAAPRSRPRPPPRRAGRPRGSRRAPSRPRGRGTSPRRGTAARRA